MWNSQWYVSHAPPSFTFHLKNQQISKNTAQPLTKPALSNKFFKFYRQFYQNASHPSNTETTGRTVLFPTGPSPAEDTFTVPPPLTSLGLRGEFPVMEGLMGRQCYNADRRGLHKTTLRRGMDPCGFWNVASRTKETWCMIFKPVL